MRVLHTLLSVILLCIQVARAEIVPLDIILDADSEEVHYVRGWLEAPAVIDIKKVSFLTSPVPQSWETDDLTDDEEMDDQDTFDENDNGTTSPTPFDPFAGGFIPPPTGDDTFDSPSASPGDSPTGSDSGSGRGSDTGGGGDDGDEDAPSGGPLNDGSGSGFDGGDGGDTGGDGGFDGGDGGDTSGSDGDNTGGDGDLDGGDISGSDGDNNGENGGLDGGDGSDTGGDGDLEGGDASGSDGDDTDGDDDLDGGDTSGSDGDNTGGDGGLDGGDGSDTGGNGGLDGGDGGDTGGDGDLDGGDTGGNGGLDGGDGSDTGGDGGLNGGDGSDTGGNGGHGGGTGGNGGHKGGTGGGADGLDGGDGDNGGGEDGGSDGGDGGVRRKLEGITQKLHFVLFSIPDNCKEDMFGNCDWTALGVGATDELVEGDISYCCSEDTASRNICGEENIGKLIVDPVLFTGKERFLDVPQTVNTPFQFPEADTKFQIEEKGDYVLLMGNCFDDGLDVLEMGSMEWKAENRGYVPGHLYGLMLFYAVLTVYYFVLALFYKCGMRIFQDAAIPIQKYIFATILLGFLELLCRAIDLGFWDVNGQRSVYVLYASLGLGVLKRGISNSLGVMVAKGWGIVRESLGMALAKIIMLGLIYTGLTGFRDFSLIIAEEDVEKISVTEEGELFDIALILTLVIMVLDLIFYFWILDSLNATTDYLRNMNQTSKLRRHLRLRCLMLTSMTIAAAWLIFTIVDKVMGGILRRDQKWFLDGVMQLNYTLIMTGVAILWRPNANAKDYAMQMEIPTMGADDENDLELSCVVPSAGDMYDGNDPDHPNGIRSNMGQYS